MKLGGVLGETDGLGSDDPRVVVGIGINGDWAAADFPPELADAMTSLREASAGRPIDPVALFGAFVERVEVRIEALRAGVFKYDWKQKVNYPIKEGDTAIEVFAVYKDNRGVLWLGTHNGGAYQFNGATFEKFRP